MSELNLPDNLDMTPRDALEYARMARAYSDGFTCVVKFARGYWENLLPLAENPAIPFRRLRTSEARHAVVVTADGHRLRFHALPEAGL